MESASSIPRRRRRPSSVSRKKPPYAPSTCSQRPCRRGDLLQGIDRARVGGAAAGHDQEGSEPLLPVLLDGRLQGVHPEAEALVRGQLAEVRRRKAREERG